MAATVRCPNPACSQLVALEALQGPGTFSCPRCGQRFALRAPVAPPPPAPPAPPALPVATPAVAPVPGDEPIIATAGPGRRRRSPRQLGVVILASVVGAGVILALIVLLIGKLRKSEEKRWKKYGDFGLAIREPSRAWQRDEETRDLLGCTWGWSRGDPVCLCGLAAEKQGADEPSPAELFDGFERRMKRFLPDLTWKMPAPSTRDLPIATGTLAEQEAYVLEFQGQNEGKSYEGECYTLAHRGFSYWFIVFSPHASDPEVQAHQRRERDNLRGNIGFARRPRSGR